MDEFRGGVTRWRDDLRVSSLKVRQRREKGQEEDKGRGKRDGVYVRTVCPSLHQVANVHDYGVFDGRSVDKLSWFVRIFYLVCISSLSIRKKVSDKYHTCKPPQSS